jgi:hypothetical protein
MRRPLTWSLLFVSLAAPAGWASTACPPSPSTSTVPAGISLVGQAGAPDPVGTVTYVIRDLTQNPYPGATVMLNFSACSDVRLASDVVAPGTIVNCAYSTVTGITDMTGTVTFRIVGSGIPGSARTLPACLSATADGVPLQPSIVSAFDLDGVNGVNCRDASVLAGDLFSGQYRGRSDFNSDGKVDALDLGLFARAMFGGGSTSSGHASCGP